VKAVDEGNVGKPVGETSSRIEADAKMRKQFKDADPKVIESVEEARRRKECSIASVTMA
jgi:hypothetical protein